MRSPAARRFSAAQGLRYDKLIRAAAKELSNKNRDNSEGDGSRWTDAPPSAGSRLG